MGMVVLGEPTLPLLESWPPGHPLWIPTPLWVSPRHWWRAFGVCVQLTEWNLLMEILHKLMQFMISEVAKLQLEMVQSFLTWVRIIRWWVGFSLFLWGWKLEFWRVPSHYYDKWFDMGFWRDHSPNGKGIALQLDCLNGSACSTFHVLCWAEQSYQFHCRVMEHIQWMGVVHFNAHFDDVLFCDRGGIQQSVIFLCNNKKAHSTFKIGFVRWNMISARGSDWGCGGHISSVLESCTMLFKIFILTVIGSSRLSQCILSIEITVCLGNFMQLMQ